MNAAIQTARITAAIHRVATAISDFAHTLHTSGLTAAYNATCRQAALLRLDLLEVSAETRDLTIKAKIDFAAAVKAAEEELAETIEDIGVQHMKVRGKVVAKLSDVNAAALSAKEALDAHTA